MKRRDSLLVVEESEGNNNELMCVLVPNSNFANNGQISLSSSHYQIIFLLFSLNNMPACECGVWGNIFTNILFFTIIVFGVYYE